MLVVLGWFVASRRARRTLSPSLMQVIEHVRKGTLDFVLLKPPTRSSWSRSRRSSLAPDRSVGRRVIFGIAFHGSGGHPA